MLEKFPNEPQDIEVVVILGQPVKNASKSEVDGTMRGLDARVIYYDQLIQETQESYSDYLETNARLSKISAVLDDLDRPADNQTSSA